MSTVHCRIGEHNTSTTYYTTPNNAMEKWGRNSKTQGKSGNGTTRTQQRQINIIFYVSIQTLDMKHDEEARNGNSKVILYDRYKQVI